MDDSIAQTRGGFARLRPLELPGWKAAASWIGAALLCVLFVTAGVWKITDVQGAAMRMAQARVPESLSMAAAVLFGIAETFSGVLVLVPRYRRWGAILTGLLLVAFMVYMGVNYNALRGEDCSCFPWIKRAVGPAFFIGDAAMLAMALVAGVWSKRSEGLRGAVVMLGAVAVFALVSFGAVQVQQSGPRAPDSILVDGRPYSLQEGRILLYYFNPECMHCFDAARRMSQYRWRAAKIVAVPVEVPQYGGQFVRDTGLPAVVSSDFDKLRKVFGFPGYPFGIAIENGHERARLTKFEGEQPATALRGLGFIE
ncbi:MAG TPA: MauE/DoxX family redox-associated membrane protein [Bryobacteraceae bacterium]